MKTRKHSRRSTGSEHQQHQQHEKAPRGIIVAMNGFTDKWTAAGAQEILMLIEQAVAEEREACAKIADQWKGWQRLAVMTGPRDDDLDLAERIAFNIRLRGKDTRTVAT